MESHHHPWLGTQFLVTFNVYLAIQARVDKRVQVVLGRDALDWRLKNACALCMYKLEGETPLEIPSMCTFDRNNSLSRFETREREEDLADGTSVPGASKERRDGHVVPGDYYLPWDEVNKWAKEGMDELMKTFSPDVEDDDEQDSCTERWQNMKEDVTSCTYGLYDEMVFFPCLCRHSFVLVVVDIVKSGELFVLSFLFFCFLCLTAFAFSPAQSMDYPSLRTSSMFWVRSQSAPTSGASSRRKSRHTQPSVNSVPRTR